MTIHDAQQYLEEFLSCNEQLRPTDSFVAGEPFAATEDGVSYYVATWVDEEGRAARGGVSYYIFPDGQVLTPMGGSGAQRESVSEIVARWRSLLA